MIVLYREQLVLLLVHYCGLCFVLARTFTLLYQQPVSCGRGQQNYKRERERERERALLAPASRNAFSEDYLGPSSSALNRERARTHPLKLFEEKGEQGLGWANNQTDYIRSDFHVSFFVLSYFYDPAHSFGTSEATPIPVELWYIH